jgi:Rieske Fe-S protein
LDSNVDDSLIVVRTAENSYVAASIKCTHRGVEVEYRADEKCFKCASLGGSRFKTNGEKMRGFAKGPLKAYPVSLEGDILLVRLQ